MVNEPDESSPKSPSMGDPSHPSKHKSSEPPGRPGDQAASDSAESHGVDSDETDLKKTSSDSPTATAVKQGAAEEHPASSREDDQDPHQNPESALVSAGEYAPHDEHHYHKPDRSHEAEDESWEDEEGEGGGPVKSFLEHLEDLRWVIIRSVISVLIAMVVCLAAANKIVDLLKEPLEKAQMIAGKTEGYIALVQSSPSSTNLYPIKLDTNRFGAIDFGSNRAMKVIMEPVLIGTNITMGLSAVPAKEEEIPYEMLVSLKNMGPISPFVVALKIALFGGLGLASPFVFFFIGQFVVPALHQKERRYLYRALAIGTGLFCTGVAFCYFAMLQIALNAAMKFSRWMNFEPDIWRAEDYISFVVKFLLGMGLSFELPVVLLTLVKLELLDYQRMSKFRPFWVVANLVLAAMLTPPDIVSQLLMAIPLQVLYEISVLIAWYWHRRDQKRMKEEEAAEAGT